MPRVNGAGEAIFSLVVDRGGAGAARPDVNEQPSHSPRLFMPDKTSTGATTFVRWKLINPKSGGASNNGLYIQ